MVFIWLYRDKTKTCCVCCAVPFTAHAVLFAAHAGGAAGQGLLLNALQLCFSCLCFLKHRLGVLQHLRLEAIVAALLSLPLDLLGLLCQLLDL